MTHWKKACGREADIIAFAVATLHGLTVEAIRGPLRDQRHNVPRQHLMAALAETGRYSHTEIGRFLGGRHYSTVMSGIQTHMARKQGRKLSRGRIESRTWLSGETETDRLEERLLWQYGEARTLAIMQQTCPATRADLAAWNQLGRAHERRAGL